MPYLTLPRFSSRRLAFIAILFGSLLLKGTAADLLVQGKAGAGGDGSSGHPFNTIQQGLDQAKAGDSVTVLPGIYHEEITVKHGGTADAPLILRARTIGSVIVDGAVPVTDLILGAAGAGLDGTDIWKSTSYHSPYIAMQDPWGLRAGWLKQGPTGQEQVELCSRNDMVWMDGQFLTEVNRPQDLTAGTFYVDRNANTLEVALPAGDKPDQHLVEVAKLGTLFQPDNGASYVDVRGIHFTRSASGYGNGVVKFGTYATTDWKAEDNVVDYGSWGGILLYGTHNQILRNVSSHNGCEGISGIVKDTVLDGNASLYNNWKAIADTYEAGGGKFTESKRLLIRNHEAAYNRGPGIWFDINNSDITLEHVRAHENHYSGIFFEISPGPIVVRDCQAWGNAGAGITIAESNNALVENNVCNQNWFGIELRNLPNRMSRYGEGGTADNHLFQTSDVTLRGNILFHNTLSGIAATSAYLDPVGRHIASDNNLFFDNIPILWCIAGPKDQLNGLNPSAAISGKFNNFWILASLDGCHKFGFEQNSKGVDANVMVNAWMYGFQGAEKVPRFTTPPAPPAPALPSPAPTALPPVPGTTGTAASP